MTFTQKPFLLLAFCGLVSIAHGWERYHVKDIGWPPAPYDYNVRTIAMNAAGQVILFGSDSNYRARAYFYNNAPLADLGALPGYTTSVVPDSITDNGDICGTCSGTNSSTLFLYHNGVMTNLGAALGFPQSSHGLLSNNGHLAGQATLDGTNWLAFLYAAGQVTQLPALPAFNAMVNPMGINDAGQVACISWTRFEDTRACVFSDGQMIDLGTLPFPNDGDSNTVGINSRGKVIGGSGRTRSFVYDGTGLLDLGMLPGYDYSAAAEAMNDSDDIVGSAWSTWGTSVGFIYRGGQMANLNDLLSPRGVWRVLDAISINASGQILAQGYTNSSTTSVLVLTPIVLHQSVQVSGGQLVTKVTGLEEGDIVVLESSSNLHDWNSIYTNTTQGSSTSFTNAIDAAKPTQFFRVRL